MKLILAVFLFLMVNACTPKEKETNSPIAAVNSITEKNKELIRQVFYDMVAKKNYNLLDTLCAPNIFDHGALEGQQQGREGFKKAVIEFLGMFSQIEVKWGDIVAEADLVSTRETWKITMASTNKVLTGETMHFFRIKDGQITDEWSKGWEFLGL